MRVFTAVPTVAGRRAATVLSLASAGLLTSCMLFAKPPADLDYSRTRTSAAGHYRPTIHPQGDSTCRPNPPRPWHCLH